MSIEVTVKVGERIAVSSSPPSDYWCEIIYAGMPSKDAFSIIASVKSTTPSFGMPPIPIISNMQLYYAISTKEINPMGIRITLVDVNSKSLTARIDEESAPTKFKWQSK